MMMILCNILSCKKKQVLSNYEDSIAQSTLACARSIYLDIGHRIISSHGNCAYLTYWVCMSDLKLHRLSVTEGSFSSVDVT